jgi:CTP:phosphocholine cytidylyltransferase-like protein
MKTYYLPIILAAGIISNCAPTTQNTYKEFYAARKFRAVSVSSDASLMQDRIGAGAKFFL